MCRAEVNPQKERGKKTKQQVECNGCGRRSSGSPPHTAGPGRGRASAAVLCVLMANPGERKRTLGYSCPSVYPISPYWQREQEKMRNHLKQRSALGASVRVSESAREGAAAGGAPVDSPHSPGRAKPSVLSGRQVWHPSRFALFQEDDQIRLGK